MRQIVLMSMAAVFSAALAVADELPARPVLLEPTWILNSTDMHLWLDAWDYDTFTTDADGNVTAWADKSGNGHDATAYKIGDTQVYGTVGLTNGVPAYLMGDRGSGIDLKFALCSTVRTVFWVMDIDVKTVYSASEPMAFFLGASGFYDFHRGYRGEIAGGDANAAFRNGLFRVDGDDSYSGNLTTKVPPAGLHLYTSVPTNDLHASQLSRDRSQALRHGGKALSELVLLNRPLNANEIETMETYFRAKWFGAAGETLAAETLIDRPQAYPGLTLDEGAGLVLGANAYAASADTPCVAVFGTLRKSLAGKIRIVSSSRLLPARKVLLACGTADGISSLDDFELVNFPEGAAFEWDGTRLTVSYDVPREFVPAVMRGDVSRRAALWLDAADAASFTTNETGGVTAWADKSGSGNDALAYQIGSEQKYGVRGMTNGYPAFLMGPCGSDIDLKFIQKQYEYMFVRTAYWVMDIVQNVPSTDPWPTAFFLGSSGYCDFHRGQVSPNNSMIADVSSASAGFKNSDFRIDGVQVDPKVTKPSLGTHIYSSFMTEDCHTTMLSSDRGLGKRNGGRALSELVLFSFELTDSEKAQMADYLNAKWYGATVALSSETNGLMAPISFPNVVLNEGARFKVGGAALRTAAAGVSVFGLLQKGTAEKVNIDYVGAPVGKGAVTVFEFADLYGYAKEDFVVTGLPADARVFWEGNALKVFFPETPVVPVPLAATGDEAPWIWLDAWDATTFTTNAEGGVTTWADKGARGHDATAYAVGGQTFYGTVGLTNGVPAYLMGDNGSGIDLKFAYDDQVRTIFWVMDMVRSGTTDCRPFLLGCNGSGDWRNDYDFHRGVSGQLVSEEANDNFENGFFSVDGDSATYTGHLRTTFPAVGTHLYEAVTLGACRASQLTRDRASTTRVSGRALSELIIFNRELSAAESTAVRNYLNAKWFGASAALASATNAVGPITFPYLTVDEGASFVVSRSALSRTDAAITVFGELAKGTAEKVRIVFADGETLPGGTRTLLSCAGTNGLTLDDFELVGFPEGVEFAWDGRNLTVMNQLGLMILVK